MSRFEALGHFVYEKGERIGVTPPEAAVELARKLNAYQMRVERLKAEVERLTAELSYDNRVQLHIDKLAAEFTQAQVERLIKAGDEVIREWSSGDEMAARNFMKALVIWNAAKEGKGQP
jgi:hypothetical protein